MPNAGDPPGWLPDPDDRSGMRWWNGLGWSDARQPADEGARRVQEAAAQAAAASTVSPQQVARTAAQRTYPTFAEVSRTAQRTATSNGLAIAAVVLGVLSLFLGFLGVLQIIGLILSVRALGRSRRLAADGVPRTGLVPALVGLLLSAVSIIAWAPVFVVAIEGFVEAFVNG